MCRLSKWHRGRSERPILPYTKFINARHPMQLTNAAKQVDYYPLTSAGKGFVRRVTWHPGCERTQMVTFSTITKSDMVYDVNQYILNGAEVTDFNLEAYQGSDYSPMAC